MTDEYNQLQKLIQSYPPIRDVLFICSSNAKGVYLQALDIANGSIIRTYNADSSGVEATCFCVAGQDYLICALKHKPLIFVWKTNWDHIHLRIACTGIVNALACDPRSVYCVGGIAEKINIWEISTGHLLAQVAKHYQNVSALYFTNDGHHFLSGGEDGIVITWNLAKVLSQERYSHCKSLSPNTPVPLSEQTYAYSNPSQGSGPFHIWSDHSMPVTDICSNGAEHQDDLRIITCSLDASCKLYDFASGSLLTTFLFSNPVTRVTLSPDNMWLYIGTTNGHIVAKPLFLPHATNRPVIDGTECSNIHSYTLNQHSKAITGLLFSSDGHLVSSSEDGYSFMWDLQSKQVLRKDKFKGPVIGVRQKQQGNPAGFSLDKHFGKQLSYSRDESFQHDVPIRPGNITILSDNVAESLNELCGDDVIDKFLFKPTINASITDKDIKCLNGDVDEVIAREMNELRDVHKKLYSFAMEKLTSA